jgi:hypothetical protein
MLTPVPDPVAAQQVSIVTRVTSSIMNTNFRSLVSFNHIHSPANCQEAIENARANLHESPIFYMVMAEFINIMLMPRSFTTCSLIYLITLFHLWTQSGSTLAETPFNRFGLLTAYTYIYIGLLIYMGIMNDAIVYMVVVTIFSFFHAACHRIQDQQSTTQDVV